MTFQKRKTYNLNLFERHIRFGRFALSPPSPPLRLPDPDLLLGRIEYLTLRGNFSGALEVINHAVVTFPSFMPALVVKMRIQMAMQVIPGLQWIERMRDNMYLRALPNTAK